MLWGEGFSSQGTLSLAQEDRRLSFEETFLKTQFVARKRLLLKVRKEQVQIAISCVLRSARLLIKGLFQDQPIKSDKYCLFTETSILLKVLDFSKVFWRLLKIFTYFEKNAECGEKRKSE